MYSRDFRSKINDYGIKRDSMKINDSDSEGSEEDELGRVIEGDDNKSSEE